TLRGVARAVLLATGHTIDDAAPAITSLAPGQTLALYMGVAQYGDITTALVDAGHDPATPAAIVESGTTDEQRIVRTELRSLAAAAAALQVRAPALLIVGETTRYAERYSWFAPSRIETYVDAAAERARSAT